MGIEERDYDPEKQRKLAESNPGGSEETGAGPLNLDRGERQRPTGNIGYLLMPLIALAGLWYGADVFLSKQAAEKHPIPQVVMPDDRSISGGIQIKADTQGHFRGSLLINNLAMPFLIDTGATKTSVPEKYAVAAGLRLGAAVQSETAGGRVTDYRTRIDSLKLGNIELRNLDANINQYLDEVLIGMNTLKYFRIEQIGNTLTLIAEATASTGADSGEGDDAAVYISQPPSKQPGVIKKTVSCDERNVCVTQYSDR